MRTKAIVDSTRVHAAPRRPLARTAAAVPSDHNEKALS